MADKKGKHRLDCPKLTTTQYRKKVSLLKSIFKKEMLEYIGGSRKNAVKQLPYGYENLVAAWKSLEHALDERWLGALMQGQRFIFNRVTPFVLRIAQEDADFQIKKFLDEFPNRRISGARIRLIASRNEDLKMKDRIDAARDARHAAAKALAIAFKNEKMDQVRRKQEAEVEQKKAAELEKQRRSNSRKAKKAQEAIMASMTAQTS